MKKSLLALFILLLMVALDAFSDPPEKIVVMDAGTQSVNGFYDLEYFDEIDVRYVHSTNQGEVLWGHYLDFGEPKLDEPEPIWDWTFSNDLSNTIWYGGQSYINDPVSVDWWWTVDGDDPLPIVSNADDIKYLSYSSSIFTEHENDDGSVSNSIIISYTANFDELAGDIDDDFVELGKITVTNVPDGLTPQIIKTADNELTFSLEGSAHNHDQDDRVLNITVEFQDSAFEYTSASFVFGYLKSDISLQFILTFSGGSGDDEDPFLIANKMDLKRLSENWGGDLWDMHFKQIADIVFEAADFEEGGDFYNDNEGWIPIGDYNKIFSGSYDGGGNIIAGLKINRPSTHDIGLFRFNHGIIKNLGVKNVDIIGFFVTGGLAGENSGTIQNCYVTGNVEGYDAVGGFVGWSWAGNISNCYASVNVVGIRQVGGFAGHLHGGIITQNSYSTGSVTRSGGTDTELGGFCGRNYQSKIINCYSTGSVIFDGVTQTDKGFCGVVDKGGSYQMSGNFWDTETSGASSTVGDATGLPTDDMKNIATFTVAEWDFQCETAHGEDYLWGINSSNNNGYPFLSWQGYVSVNCPQWTGSDDTDWGNTGNWLNGVPAENFSVFISPGNNNPILDQERTIGNLHIDADASLSIPPGAGLTVNGVLTNNAGEAGLVIKSNTDGTGSLIHTTAGVEATVERCFPQTVQSWHMLAAPVAANIAAGNFAPGDNDSFYAWHEPSPGTWVNFKNTSVSPSFPEVNGDDFVKGKGYLVAYTGENPTKNFTGTLNTSIIKIELTNSAAKSWDYNAGWNLLGNPYSSGIDWNLVDKSQFQDSFAYAYNPNVGGGSYVYIDGNKSNAFIGPHQAFFVRATTEANHKNFTFNPSIQVHGGSFLKSNTSGSGIVLRLTSGNYFDETTLRIREGSSFDRDRQDALKLFSLNQSVPQIYSLSDDEIRLAVNSIPQTEAEKAIPLGLKLPHDGTFSIAMQQSDELMNVAGVFLEDRTQDQFIKLCNQAHTFTAETGIVSGRFFLHFGMVGVETYNAGIPVRVAQQGDKLVLLGAEDYNQVQMFDLQGRLLFSGKLNGSSLQYLDAPGSPGLYIVVVKNSHLSTTQRVVVM